MAKKFTEFFQTLGNLVDSWPDEIIMSNILSGDRYWSPPKGVICLNLQIKIKHNSSQLKNQPTGPNKLPDLFYFYIEVEGL